MTTAEQLKAWEDGLEAYKKDGLTYWIGGYEKIIEKLRAQLILKLKLAAALNMAAYFLMFLNGFPQKLLKNVYLLCGISFMN